jgi:hypothetical protein
VPGNRHPGPGEAGQKYNLEVIIMLQTGKKSCSSGKETGLEGPAGTEVAAGCQAKVCNEYGRDTSDNISYESADDGIPCILDTDRTEINRQDIEDSIG